MLRSGYGLSAWKKRRKTSILNSEAKHDGESIYSDVENIIVSDVINVIDVKCLNFYAYMHFFILFLIYHYLFMAWKM